MRLLDPQATASLSFLWYRYRFLSSYIAIGVLSLVIEAGLIRMMEGFGLQRPYATVLGIGAGVFAAYFLNVRFNFRIPAAKRWQAFRYFMIVSAFSLTLNFLLKSQLASFGWTYERSRLTTAAALFLIAYALHRRFSFRGFKQLGIAVYVDRVEDIRGIWDRVGSFPNFIHVDLVDSSVAPHKPEPASNRAEVVRAFWPHKPVHVHVMSRTPSRWLPDLLPFCDAVIVHLDLDEPVTQVLAAIRSGKRRAGLCLRIDESPELLRPYLHEIDLVLLLAIADPGSSGQSQDSRVLEHIRAINKWPEREQLDLCVDGGVNEQNIGSLDVEFVVSGSSVLNHGDPQRQILRLQTSSNYEAP